MKRELLRYGLLFVGATASVFLLKDAGFDGWWTGLPGAVTTELLVSALVRVVRREVRP